MVNAAFEKVEGLNNNDKIELLNEMQTALPDVFDGVRLPDAYENISTHADTENWVVRSALFSFGYAECYNNLDYNTSLKANLFDISNAVDNAGNKVTLTGIRFIKVQSSVFQVAGWLNEVSTEVSGAADLSLIEYSAN